jgi:hypothetical protein
MLPNLYKTLRFRLLLLLQLQLQQPYHLRLLLHQFLQLDQRPGQQPGQRQRQQQHLRRHYLHIQEKKYEPLTPLQVKYYPMEMLSLQEETSG